MNEEKPISLRVEGLYDAETPFLTIIQRCELCDIELSRYTFDVRQDDEYRARARAIGEEQAEQALEHLNAVHPEAAP